MPFSLVIASVQSLESLVQPITYDLDIPPCHDGTLSNIISVDLLVFLFLFNFPVVKPYSSFFFLSHGVPMNCGLFFFPNASNTFL